MDFSETQFLVEKLISGMQRTQGARKPPSLLWRIVEQNCIQASEGSSRFSFPPEKYMLMAKSGQVHKLRR